MVAVSSADLSLDDIIKSSSSSRGRRMASGRARRKPRGPVGSRLTYGRGGFHARGGGYQSRGGFHARGGGLQSRVQNAFPHQGGGILPNPPGGMNWGSSVPMSFGVSNQYNMGFANQNYAQGMGALGQPSILGRLGGMANTGGSLTGLDRPIMPSILDRLDAGIGSGSNWLGNPPLMGNAPNVLSRVGNMSSSGSIVNRVGNMSSSGSIVNRVGGHGGSILNRVGDRSGNVQSGMAGNRPWSYAIIGGEPVNPQNKPKNPQQNQQGNQQKKKGNQQGQQQQQQGKKKKVKKTAPTAEELDAELDAYLREMNTAK